MTERINHTGKLSHKLYAFFSSDQPFYAQQQEDGTYHKKHGFLSASIINKSLNELGSLAVYQKQQDFTVKWICYDFDILKEHLDRESRTSANQELLSSVQYFVNYLSTKNIPYLLEYSGNRGYHVWILFSNSIYYSTASEVLESILTNSGLEYDKELIGIDKFPKTSKPSSGVGLGVKLPLSLHKKSGAYSYLISDDQINEQKAIKSLTESFIKENLSILEQAKTISLQELEKCLNRIFTKYDTNDVKNIRIKSIIINKKIDLDTILEHWGKSSVLNVLSKKIKQKSTLNNEDRKLLVGLLSSIENIDSKKILHSIFKKFDNYKPTLTEDAIKKLKGYYFPSQEQIESTLDTKFDVELSIEELLTECIPYYSNHLISHFEFNNIDVDVVRKSENNYLLMNDEVQSKVIIDNLIHEDNSYYFNFASNLIGKVSKPIYYEHKRQEDNKTRSLITLDAKTRVATSLILKQISNYLDINTSGFSHGYQVNKNFSRLHIFKPWLNQWNTFISNVNEAVNEPIFQESYIIKTDISSFYESISHDRLQRIILGDGNSEIKNKLKFLDSENLSRYKELVNCLLTVSKDIQGSNTGLPQGPAYARYLAEIYLIELDYILKDLYLKGEVYLYQRYVDDIFLVCESETKANMILDKVKEIFASLNLKINESKTTIKKIINSKSDFENYKSQSKYNVDNINKNIEIANENQKELAIDEFIQLIESDSAQHDLSFIFSHLEQIEELDDVKMEMVADALDSGLGRGSMYRNMFSFLLQNKERFDLSLLGKKLNSLQSEVITSVLVNLYESDRENWDSLHYFLTSIKDNVTRTTLTEQNMAYIVLCYGYTPDFSLDDNRYIEVLSSSPNIIANENLFKSLNFKLNEINDLNIFINTLSNLAFSIGTNKEIISFSRNLLFSKLSIEELANRLDIQDEKNLVLTESNLSNLYNFLCLYSISNLDDISNNNQINSYWKFCIHSVDIIGSQANFDYSDWTKFIEFIDVDYNRLNMILSFISIGSMITGVTDKHKLFLDYHSVLLVFFILERNNYNNELVAIDQTIEEQLVKTSEFYRWILREPTTEIFPNNKTWFESNATSNGIILLKKDEEVLIRKHASQFDSSLNIKQDKYGYSEVVVKYKSNELVNIREKVRNLKFKERLKLIYELIGNTDDKSTFPSIFTNSRVIEKSKKSIFNKELSYYKKIISEQKNSEVSSVEVSLENYLSTYLKLLSDDFDTENILLNKYHLNMEKSVDIVLFFESLSNLYIVDEIDISEAALDILVSSSLYKTFQSPFPYERVEKFIHQYVKFHSDNYLNMNSFAVEKQLDLKSDNFEEFMSVLISSVEIVKEKQYVGIEYPIVDDFKEISSSIATLISTTHAGQNNFTSIDFVSAKNWNLNSSEGKLVIDGVETLFSNTEIIDLSKFEVKPLNAITRTKITGADKIYYFKSEDGLIALPIPSAMMKIWNIIFKRFSILIEEQNKDFGYEVIGNIENIKGYQSFPQACYVVQQHNNITDKEAEERLVKWLLPISAVNRELILKLISAHECMTKIDIENFISKINDTIENHGNVFMIKNPEDYNGTQRVLYSDLTSQVARNIKSFNISRVCDLQDDTREITFILDNIISGSQFISAMKYYTGKRDSFLEHENLYEIPEDKLHEVRSFFKKLTRINICTIFYNTKAKIRIVKELKELIPNLESVDIIHGKNIGGNAYFGTTEKLTASDRVCLANFLLDDEKRQALHESVGIRFNKDVKKFRNMDELNDMNLISRYCSMPKNCFMFLIAPSIFDKNVRILNRFEELNSKKYLK